MNTDHGSCTLVITGGRFHRTHVSLNSMQTRCTVIMHIDSVFKECLQPHLGLIMVYRADPCTHPGGLHKETVHLIM